MFAIIFTIFLASIARSTIFEYWGVKTNVRIEYIEVKWYIKPAKFGYGRVKKNITNCTGRRSVWKSCQYQICNT